MQKCKNPNCYQGNSAAPINTHKIEQGIPTYFLPVRRDYSLQKLAKLYIVKIVRLHGVLVSIISNRDPHFTSRFWEKLHEALCTCLDFSTTLHP
ncbi:integrase [Gossypium australe]|uniref:Integrase n=1 Tax=Gossypium australe TaxID=47621 RepID=A0A5B6X129_9ROSI|nr:integrase [Gossypium australe]